jgi:hypothetical protein
LINQYLSQELFDIIRQGQRHQLKQRYNDKQITHEDHIITGAVSQAFVMFVFHEMRYQCYQPLSKKAVRNKDIKQGIDYTAKNSQQTI